MKNSFLSIFLLMLPLAAWSDNINFANSSNKAICVRNWDLDKDGELSTDEAAAVTDLGVFFRQGLVSGTFNELQYFTGLTSIGDFAFQNSSDLTSVTIPNSVTSIGDYAFAGCSGLTSVTIPNSVTSIGDNAFAGCSGLTSVTIPNSVTSIGDDAFYNCSGLTSVTIPNSVTSIGNWAFYGCSGLTSITIPNSVTSLGNYAFASCSGLTSVTIPNSVTSIGNYAFRGCSGLTSITIPNSVTSLGGGAFEETRWYSNQPDGVVYAGKVAYKYKGRMPSNTSIIIEDGTLGIAGYAFDGCSGLTSVTIPNSVTSLGNYAFYGCSGLTSITIPNSVTSLGNYAFASCSGLTSVTIPNSVTSIGNYAFRGCSGLTSITIPNSVTSIGSSAFYDTPWYNNQPDGLVYVGKVAYKYKGTMPSNTSIIIEDGTLGIAGYAFDGCSGLTSVTIPESVTSIDGGAFYGCSGLTSITIPESVTSIGYAAFSGCSGLTSVAIPNSVTSIGENAFYGCSGLTSVTIPESVTSIDDSAFYGCSGLTSITIPNSVTSIGGGAFYGCSGLTSVTIPNSVTIIYGSAFYGCSGLTSFTIPNSVTYIGSNAFSGCTGTVTVNCNLSRYSYSTVGGLTMSPFIGSKFSSLIIGDDVTFIGQDAFYECSSLTSVTIGNSVTSIGDYAFYGCSNLTAVHIFDLTAWCNIRHYGYDPLRYAHHLYLNGVEVKDLVIPESVTSISDFTFNGCSSLTSVTIPNSVTRICQSAFNGCSGLTSVTIPESVTSIGFRAFYGCSGLTSITIPESVTSIGDYAFSNCSNLTLAKVGIESPLSIASSTFSNRANATLYVPAGSKAAYQAANYWKNFKAIIEFPDADVNQDGAVNVVDVVDIARFVVGTPSDKFVEFIADLNSDDEVNVADAVELVNEIAGDQNFAKAYGVPRQDLGDDRLTLTENDNHSLSLALESLRPYTAFQFDLTLNSDTDVMAMALNAARKNGHQLLYNKVSDGRYRVVVLSVANNGFNGTAGELLNIQLDGFDTDELTVSNIHFITASGTDHRFDDLSLSSATGIESLTPNPSPEGEGNIYDLSGRKVSVSSANDESTVLPKGIYIKNGRKVVVK